MTRQPDARRRVPSWPVPLIAVIGVVVVVAVAIIVIGLQVQGRRFVSLSHLSGIPREAMLVYAPIIAAIACYTTGALSAKRSPASSLIAIRRTRELPALILAWFLGAALVGYFVGGGVIIAMYAPHALDGSVNWFEFVFSSLQLIALVELAILLGFLSFRWWMSVLAALATLVWMFVLPVLFGYLPITQQYSVGYEFLFPATPAFRHEPYAGMRSISVVILWVLIVCVLAAIIFWAVNIQARLATFPTLVAILGVLCLAACTWVITDARPFYADPKPGETVCATEAKWEYCVAYEEQGSLPELISLSQPIIQSAGVLAEGPHRVVSTTVWAWEGRPESPRTTAVEAVNHLSPPSTNGIAGMLSGLSACEQDGGLEFGESEERALGLATWLAGDEKWIESTGVGQALNAATPTVRNQWFETYRDEIASCQLAGVPLP